MPARAGALSAWCSAAAVVWLARPRVRASHSRDGGAGNRRRLADGCAVSQAGGESPGTLLVLRAAAGQMAIYQRILSGSAAVRTGSHNRVDRWISMRPRGSWRVYRSPIYRLARGRVLYQHIRENRPENLLELGTARGGSAVFIAAALEANGAGHLTSVDSTRWQWLDPTPREVLEKAGLSSWVTLDKRFSTYTWFLKAEIEKRLDAAGSASLNTTSSSWMAPRTGAPTGSLLSWRRGSSGRADASSSTISAGITRSIARRLGTTK